MNNNSVNEQFDLIIIGAGPAGLSCALSAAKNNLKTIMLDKGNVVNSIINFPKNMTFFSTSDFLELDNIPFTSELFRPSRNETIRYYQRIVSNNQLQFQSDSNVINIESNNDGFKIEYINKDKKCLIHSKFVVIATGFYDNPNMLNIPGENFSHVSHYYTEPYIYFGKKVAVIGGKNSAVEAALDLFRSGVDVTLVHRHNEIKQSVKYWILPDIENRISSGEIVTHLNSILKRININSIVVEKNGIETTLPADAVLLLTGYHPNTDLLDKCSIGFDSNTLEPEIDSKSLESNIKGIYLAGSIIAGRNSNKIFIENSREHGAKIINHVLNSI